MKSANTPRPALQHATRVGFPLVALLAVVLWVPTSACHSVGPNYGPYRSYRAGPDRYHEIVRFYYREHDSRYRRHYYRGLDRHYQRFYRSLERHHRRHHRRGRSVHRIGSYHRGACHEWESQWYGRYDRRDQRRGRRY